MFIVGIDEWATVGFCRIIKQRTKKHKTKYIKNSTSPFRVAKTSQSNFNVSYGLNDSNANIEKLHQSNSRIKDTWKISPYTANSIRTTHSLALCQASSHLYYLKLILFCILRFFSNNRWRHLNDLL